MFNLIDGQNETVKNCIDYSPAIRGVVSVTSEQEIKELLYEANAQGFSVYPYSRGNNWGYGAKAPISSNSVLLDLSAMNEISGYDDQLGIVTVQPGVTYQQLNHYLSSQSSQWLTPVHGGGPECSVLGNILERGFGLTPIEDHFGAARSFRCLLPDGSLYQSKLTSMGLGGIDQAGKWGIGPYLDGLFTQSNFGVVTQVTLQLAPNPQSIAMFRAGLQQSDLPKAIAAVRELQKDFRGVLGGVNLLNQARVVSMFTSYPSEKAMNNQPLTKLEIEGLSESLMAPDWTIIGSLYGPKPVVKAVSKLVQKRLKEVCGSYQYIDESRLDMAQKLFNVLPNRWFSGYRQQLSAVHEAFQIFRGTPKNTALNLAYWVRNPQLPKTFRPDADDCGLIWYSPLIEMRAERVSQFCQSMEHLSQQYGQNNLITLTCFDSSMFEATVPILYNKTVEGASKAARDFILQALAENRKLGFHPYRLPIFAMEPIYNASGDGLEDRIKRALDPNRVIAPGRYVK